MLPNSYFLWMKAIVDKSHHFLLSILFPPIWDQSESVFHLFLVTVESIALPGCHGSKRSSGVIGRWLFHNPVATGEISEC
jgi:hypothetical protein